MSRSSKFSYGRLRRETLSRDVLQDPLGLGGLLSSAASLVVSALWTSPLALVVGAALGGLALVRFLVLYIRRNELVERRLHAHFEEEKRLSERENAETLDALQRSLNALAPENARQLERLEEAFSALSRVVEQRFPAGSLSAERYLGGILETRRVVLHNLHQVTRYLQAAQVTTTNHERVHEEKEVLLEEVTRFTEQNELLIGELHALRLKLVRVPLAGSHAPLSTLDAPSDEEVSRRLDQLAQTTERMVTELRRHP